MAGIRKGLQSVPAARQVHEDSWNGTLAGVASPRLEENHSAAGPPGQRESVREDAR
jgi:hypothetical protein